MESEDLRAAIIAHGMCGVPVRDGGSCEQVKDHCTVHTEAWHATRELASMWSEDPRCGVTPRRCGNPCEHIRGNCPYHAVESVRCTSVLEDDPCARCWNHRWDGSDFCENHQDRPNLWLALKEFFRERESKPITEEDFRAWEKTHFPNAAQEFGPILNFSN